MIPNYLSAPLVLEGFGREKCFGCTSCPLRFREREILWLSGVLGLSFKLEHLWRNEIGFPALVVKALYIKNLPKDITQDQLRELFEDHGKIIKVVLPPAKAGQEKSRFGFVHFAERSSAMKALKNKEKYEIDGQVLECSLAKPQADQKLSAGPNSQKLRLHP